MSSEYVTGRRVKRLCPECDAQMCKAVPTSSQSLLWLADGEAVAVRWGKIYDALDRGDILLKSTRAEFVIDALSNEYKLVFDYCVSCQKFFYTPEYVSKKLGIPVQKARELQRLATHRARAMIPRSLNPHPTS